MSPSEPPVSIYGTLPRSVGKMVAAPLGNSPALSSHYATFRKEKLGPRTSLKLMAMMKEGARREEDTRSIISGFTEGSGSRGEERLRQGVSFNRLPQPQPQPQQQQQQPEEVDQQEEATVELSNAWHGWGGKIVSRHQ